MTPELLVPVWVVLALVSAYVGEKVVDRWRR